MSLRPPLLWVPGHLCGGWLYEPQRAVFGGDLADVTLDDSIGAMAIRALAGAPDRVVVAGLSMGAMVALEMIVRAPDQIAGALLMATDPTPCRPKERVWRAELLARGPAAYTGTFTSRFFEHDAAVASRLGADVGRRAQGVPQDVLAGQVRALETRPDLMARIRAVSYSAPVQVIAGGADRICPVRLNRPIATAFPDARLEILPEAGHLLTLERPAEVTARLSELLARVVAHEARRRSEGQDEDS